MGFDGITGGCSRKTVINTIVFLIKRVERISLRICNIVAWKTESHTGHFLCGKAGFALWNHLINQSLQLPGLLLGLFHNAFHHETLVTGTGMVAAFHITDTGIGNCLITIKGKGSGTVKLRRIAAVNFIHISNVIIEVFQFFFALNGQRNSTENINSIRESLKVYRGKIGDI